MSTITRSHPRPSYCVATADSRATPTDVHQLLLEEAELHAQLAEVASQCRWFETTPEHHRAVGAGIERLAVRVRELPCGNRVAARRLHDELALEAGRARGPAASALRIAAAAIRDYLLDRGVARAVAERVDRPITYAAHREPDPARA